VGIAEVVREAYPDPHALDPKNKYFDEKAKKRGENPWVMVDIMAKSRFAIPVTRPMLALDPVTKTMMVLAKGSRLSIQPVQPKEFKAVLRLGNAMPL
jgi:predicted RNA-binding protein with PUA-like domain